MSVFDRMFKLKNEYSTEYQKANALNVLMEATHYKLSLSETEKLYNLLSSKTMCLTDNDSRVKESMKLLTDLKSNWLTNEEKENFVAGVWLCECATDSNNNKGITYINSEELKYTRQAVLGSSFKAINSIPLNF